MPVDVIVDGVADAIDLTLSGAPPGVTGATTIVGGSGMLTISASDAAPTGQTATATLTAVDRATNATRTTPIFVRVGHALLVADTTTTWTVPTGIDTIRVLVWGAGGGGGGGGAEGDDGGSGGSGGFAQADLRVAPGMTFSIAVGAGGAGGGWNGAGGGGGYSAVALLRGPFKMIAGGGGGGGVPANEGGNGSGSIGGDGDGTFGGWGGLGATETAGGAPGTGYWGAGSYLRGGSQCDGMGAAPGGGTGCGPHPRAGGGGGYYGGGSGTDDDYSPGGGSGGGGGGGSGFVTDEATNVIRSIGQGAAPARTDSWYYATPVATGGAPGTPTAPSGDGGHGRVVILLTD